MIEEAGTPVEETITTFLDGVRAGQFICDSVPGQAQEIFARRAVCTFFNTIISVLLARAVPFSCVAVFRQTLQSLPRQAQVRTDRRPETTGCCARKIGLHH